MKLTEATEMGSAAVQRAATEFTDAIAKIKASGADVVVRSL